MKKGFTLVELSIVLVIIGLLVGGILVGQALIESAKVGAFVSQLRQYDIAVDMFQTRYKSVPGDSKLMTNPGDGNGWIEDSTASPTLPNSGYARFDKEIANFWPHLTQAGMLKDSKKYVETGTVMVTKGTTVNIPTMNYGTNASVVAFGNQYIWNKLQYLIGDYTGGSITGTFASASFPKPAFTPVQALAIDTKMDDGVFNLGDVGAAGAGSLSECANCGTPATTCYSGSKYNVAENSLQCLLRIRMRSLTTR